MRLASFETDYWQLRSAEESNRQRSDTFWLPPLTDRQNLVIGQAVKLIFEIEAFEENGELGVQGERMWVIVSEKVNDFYIGILDNQPALVEPSDDMYLCFGAEIPFQAEHVIDIATPPKRICQLAIVSAAWKIVV